MSIRLWFRQRYRAHWYMPAGEALSKPWLCLACGKRDSNWRHKH